MPVDKVLKGQIITRFGSQAEFAEKVGMHESLVSMVIRGRRKLTDEQRKVWIKVLGIKIK